ncbi:hypothetical protein HZS_1527 [Henneguya salminicola]|nr:hypothetical protein HZS_1527 [Henneguya salminicola]
MENFENIFKPTSIFYNGYKFSKNSTRKSIQYYIYSKYQSKKCKAIEKALELASHRCLTAGSIHRQLSIQEPVSNEEFYRVPSKKQIEALARDVRGSGKKNDLSEIY